MADNETTGTGKAVATDKVTYSGDADQNLQLFRQVFVTGAEGSKTVVEITDANGLFVQGSKAHDDVDAGAPTKIGGYAKAAAPTAVVDGDRVNAWFSLAGALMVNNPTAANLNMTEASAANSLTALQLIDDPVFADDAAFTLATSKVHVVGNYAVAHGSDPTSMTAGRVGVPLMNRHHIPFMIGGHPNAITLSARRADSDNGVTDGALVTISTGSKIVVTRITVTCSNANSVNVACKVGFGTANIPADATGGAAGVLVDHEGIPPGGGFTVGDGSGILGVGADNEDLRWTVDDPVSGHVCISVTYYTVPT